MPLSQGISSGGGTGQNAPEVIYFDQFERGLQQQFQQMDSIVANYFESMPIDGEFTFFDRIGLAEEMSENVGRYGDNPISEIDLDRRRIGRREFELGKYVEPKDLVRVMTDPKDATMTAMLASGKRKRDDLVLGRIFDTAQTGHDGGTTVSFADTNSGLITVGEMSRGHSRPITTTGLYSLQEGDYEGIDVAVDYVDSGSATDSGITLAKLKAARFTMQRLEAIQQGEILDCFITSSQAEQLLGIDEIINADYSVRQALTSGVVVTFLGFRFINSERLKGAGTSGDPRQCIVAKRNSMRIAEPQGLNIQVWRDTAKKNIPYIYMSLSLDAVRQYGECTVKVNCLD